MERSVESGPNEKSPSNEIAHFDVLVRAARFRDGQTTRETIVKRKSNYLFGFELRADERFVCTDQRHNTTI